MATFIPLIPLAAPLVGMTARGAVFAGRFPRPTPPPPRVPYWSIR